MESKDIRIKIFNNHYTLKGDDIELVEKSAQHVDTLMNKVQNDIPNQSDITIAIVSALNIAENYYKEKNNNFVLDQNYKSLLNNLNSQIKEINDFIDSKS
ncbi:MAG: cell division protein ZapA [Ignavibacteriae bacterium]|nr:MAG: cell division protein ZapA [Ignavibacteriota bacterium]